MMNGESILEIRHLSKTFGTNLVLKDIDFKVDSGDVTCIIGASGSGKSTLLRCLNLLETCLLYTSRCCYCNGYRPGSFCHDLLSAIAETLKRIWG